MNEPPADEWPADEQALHRLVADFATDVAAFAIDLNLRIAVWPDGAARLFGYAREEIVGRPLADLFTPEDVRGGAPEREAEAARSAGKSSDDRWHVRKGGRRFWAIGFTTPWLDREGEIRGYVKILRDSTDERRVRRRWRRAALSLRKVSKANAFRAALSDALRTAVDAERIVDAATHLLGRHLGASRVVYAEYVGDDEISVRPGYVDGVAQAPGRYRISDYGAELHAALRSGGIVNIPDLAAAEIDGAQRVRFAALDIASLLDVPLSKEGRPVALVSVQQKAPRTWTDDEIALALETAERIWTAVERAGAESRLRELNENLERRVADRAALAERRASQLRALAAELVRAEERERRRLAELLHDHVQQLLVGAKMQIGLVRARSEKARQEELDRIDELLLEALEATRSLSIELSPPILHEQGLSAALRWLAGRFREQHGFSAVVDADPAAEPEDEELRNLLFQSARELLLNAVKHAQVKAARIRAGIGEGEIVLEVVDQGVGFDPAKAEESRDSFGLFQIRERIETVGGRFVIESAPGQGTRATIALPYEFAAAPEAGDGASELEWEEATLPAGRLKILLVDDHRIVRKGVRALLTSRFDVDVVGEASSGEEAIDQVAQLSPHVVLMDVDMPGMGGIEATRRVTSKYPDVRVIGLSLHEEEGVIDAMFAAGASRYVLKDASPEKLMSAIRSMQREE